MIRLNMIESSCDRETYGLRHPIKGQLCVSMGFPERKSGTTPGTQPVPGATARKAFALSPRPTLGPEDLDGSGFVDFGDILVVLAAWGPCK